MKKIVNGQVVDMTPEEIEEMEKQAAQLPDIAPTSEERIEALEKIIAEQDAALMELAAMLAGGY